MIQKYDFHCPHCDHKLDENNEIILLTLRTNNDVGKIFMSTSVGNYSYRHEPKNAFGNGELIMFKCTSCEKDLSAEDYVDYAKLIMKVERDIQFDVLFSRRAGVLKTYLVTEDGIESYTGT